MKNTIGGIDDQHGRPQRTALIERGLLFGVFVLCAFMVSIPRWDYPFPIHVDEWWHYGDAQSLITAGDIKYADPFDAGRTTEVDIETGYHVFLGELKSICGVSWLTLFRFLPVAIMALIAFQAYAFGKKERYGLAAAFFVGLVPTTIRFLGPAFVVPVDLGLAFLPLILLVLHRLMSDIRGPMLVFLILLGLLFVHPPSMAVLTGVVIMHLIFFLPREAALPIRSRQSVLGLVLLIPVYVIMLFWAPSVVDFVVDEATHSDLHLPLPPITGAVSEYGYIPAVLFALGCGISVYRGERPVMALGAAALGMVLFQLLYPNFYIGPDIVYERGWLYVYVMMALMGGVALVWLGQHAGHVLRLNGKASVLVIGLLVVSSFALSLRQHLAEPYYHVIDGATYHDFLWIRDHVSSEYDVCVLDTGEAWAFASVTGKYAYTAEVAPNFHDKGRSAMEFLADGATDTAWLAERGIDMVYSKSPVENNDLVQVHDNVYLLMR
ncbi:MAG: hypothetical protein FJZ95_00605 [Chloroflexi bacterium]|nr:hypothetical protein [Chloroflexota bacterium]